MIPIDVVLINKNGITNLEKYADLVQLDRNNLETIMISNNQINFPLNLGLFAFSLFLSFFLIPFSYFFGDERIEDIKPQQNELNQKICNSLKYTVRNLIKIILTLINSFSLSFSVDF